MSGEPRLVLLVGAPRSGTTWSGRVLGHTAGTAYVNEPDGDTEPYAFTARLGFGGPPTLTPGEDHRAYERLWAGAFAGGARPTGVTARAARYLNAKVEAGARFRAWYGDGPTPRLRLVDKENGGKADALNCAINASRFPLVCAIDADTLILPDALRRLARPFLQQPDLLGAGGTIGLANGGRIRHGVVLELAVPRSWLASFQVVEYLRAFLVGRLGWNRLEIGRASCRERV